MLPAIDAHKRGLDFADAIHLFAAQHCEALCTFDTDFRRKAKKLSMALAVLAP
jgi:predicted nucleic acid-binding protein